MSGSANRRAQTFLFIVILLCFPADLRAQVAPSRTSNQHEYYSFAPHYTLPGKAALYPGNKIAWSSHQPTGFAMPGETPLFRGERATDVVESFISEPLTPPFSLEFAILHHFNKPAGLALYFVDPEKQKPEVGFSFYSEKENRPAEFELFDFAANNTIVRGEGTKNFQKYWHHFIVAVEPGFIFIFHNGELVRKESIPFPVKEYDLKIAAYLEKEPHAKLGNLLQFLKIHRSAIDPKFGKSAYLDFTRQIENGKKYPSLFHFNAGPYLNNATTESIDLVWETSKPSEATLYYGEELPLQNEKKIALTTGAKKPESPCIYEATINGLMPDTKYLYNLKVKSVEGEEMESGVLSFKTAVENDQPYLFGIIGDTEARPHINDVVSKKMWAERPEFVIVLGDLTDGGVEDAKWQWNLEYFTGVNQLLSRIPAFPVPGNGEGDLYWYNKYHSLPNGEAFYSFRYGAAEFFMMNSNQRKSEFSPSGSQYRWLDSALAVSDAAWKIVAMHHAPYSADEDDYGKSYEGKSDLGDVQVRQLIPLFEKHSVDVVLFGHLHTYNTMGPIRDGRIDQNGVWYIQAGGAGGNLEDFAPTRAWFSRKTYAGHHYCTAFVDDDRLEIKTYNLEGALIDIVQITK